MNTTTVGKFFLGVMVIFFIFGCNGLGPGTISRYRFDYARAISESWKSQMLLFAFTEKEGAVAPLVTVPTG